MRVIFGDKQCDDCDRPAVAHVLKKYPARQGINKYVCGYHLRKYKTSEFKRTEIMRPTKTKVGYGINATIGEPL
jgi:hypothetical protein